MIITYRYIVISLPKRRWTFPFFIILNYRLRKAGLLDFDETIRSDVLRRNLS